MKNYLFSKLLLLGILLAISYGEAVAVPYTIQVGTTATDASVFGGAGNWNRNWEYTYRKSEITTSGFDAENGTINSIGFQFSHPNFADPAQPRLAPGDLPRNTKLRIYMANVDDSENGVQSSWTTPSTDLMWTEVFYWENFNFTKHKKATQGIDGGYLVNEWAILKFNTPEAEHGFEYTGHGLRIKICMDWTIRAGAGRVGDTSALDGSTPMNHPANVYVYSGTKTAWVFGNNLTTGGAHNPNHCDAVLGNNFGNRTAPNIQLDMELPVEHYTASEGGTTTPYVFDALYASNHRFQFLPESVYYSKPEHKAGTIKSLSLHLANIIGTGINTQDRTLRIYMAIAPENAQDLRDIAATPYEFDGWQLVYERDNPTLANLRADNGLTGYYNNGDWIEFPFNVSDFEYFDGNIMYRFCSSGSTGYTMPGGNNLAFMNGCQFYATDVSQSTQSFIGFSSAGDGTTDCQSQIGTSANWEPQQLDVRFGVAPLPSNYAKYENVIVSHPTLESTVPAATNVQVLHMNFKLSGRDGNATLSNLTFLNKSLDGYVQTAKLWYTGNDAGLNTATATPIRTIDLSNTTNKTIAINWINYLHPYEDGPQLGMGQHHFWLTFDVASGVEFNPNAIDVSLTGFTVNDASPLQNPANFGNSAGTITNPDPEGAIDVSDYLTVYCPPGVTVPSSTARTLNSGPFSGYYNLMRSRNVYTYDELNNGTPGMIGEMAVYAWSSWRQGSMTHDSVYIFMKNLPRNSGEQDTPPEHFQQENDFGSIEDMEWTKFPEKYIALGYTQVVGPFQLPHITSANDKAWIAFPFDSNFQYTGGDLDVIVHRVNIDNFDGRDGSGWSCDNAAMNSWEEARYADNGQQFWSYGVLQTDGGTLGCGQLINSVFTELIPQYGEDYSSYNVAPKSNARFSFSYIEGSRYRNSNGFHTSKPYMTNGTQADEVLGIMIETEGLDEEPYEQLNQIIFDGKNSHDVATHAMLYYSGLDSTFGAAIQLGEDVALTADNINNIQFNFEKDVVKLKNGKNYFWLAYRISDNRDNIGKEVDAQFVSGILRKYNEKLNGGFVGTYLERTLTVKDPDGVKTIVGVLPKSTYYVGHSSTITTDYETLADFADAYSQYGIDKSVDVIIVSDITDNRTATFDYNPYKEGGGQKATMHGLFLQIDPAATEDYTLTSTQNGGSVIELQPGYRNFRFLGDNDNAAKLTIEKLGIGGNAITGTQASFIVIRDANIIGNINGISIKKSEEVAIFGNTITRASNYAVLLDTVTGIVQVADNSIGSVAANVSNGLALIGCENSEVTNNRFANMTSTENNRAILVRNTPSGSTTKIHNNAINDVKSNRNFASAIELYDNSGSVDIVHNTVIFSADRGRQIYSSVLNLGAMAPDATLNVINNLFINNITPFAGLYSQQYYDPLEMTTHMTNFEDKGNVYANGEFMHATGETAYDFAAWKAERNTNTGTETALTSSYISIQGNFANVDSMDFHTDGLICNSPAILIDVVNMDLQDIDGANRGNFISGTTTAGADEFFPMAKNVADSDIIPATIAMCENSYESIILKIDRSFEGWSDGVTTRAYIPQVTNQWITDKGDTVKNENGIDLTRPQYLYIEHPNYTHTMKLKCVSIFWIDTFETDWCDINIMRAPFLRDVPNVAGCWDGTAGGTIEVEAADFLEGSAKSFQWQKKAGTTWSNVAGQTTSKLSRTFTNDPNDIDAIKGTYRLQITPYEQCADIAGDVLSNEIEVNIGSPLSGNSTLDMVTSIDDAIEQVQEGNVSINLAKVCVNNEIWLTAELVTQSQLIGVTQYQWQQYDASSETWKPIEAVINPTATSATLRIHSTRSEHSGLYRCAGYGCSAEDIIYTEPLRIEITPASEILLQPAPVTLSCVGRRLTDEISVSITDPTNEVAQFNKYQWFKDGKEFKRLDNAGNEITPSHALYATYRTDTTYLPFARLAVADGGEYTLRTIYINCEQEEDTLFSDTARLYAYNPALFKSQSDSIYVSINGYATLEMNMLTDIANNDENLGVTYLWYRQRVVKTPTGNRAIIDTLRSNSRFTVMQGQLSINNITVMDVNILDSITLSDNYYCVVTDYCTGTKLTSKPMKLKLAPEITIVKSPDSSIVCEGENVTMIATATSADNTIELIYEWYKVVGGAPVILSGENDTTLVLSAVNADDVADYYCVVSLKDLAGANKRTNVANLIINPKPIISNIDYPAGGVVAENSPFTLTAVVESMATGTYQWYFNGAPIAGATSIDYTVTAATKANEGTYYVIATNDCGETQSTPVEIKISVGIATTNDDPAFHIVSVSPNPVANDATIKFVVPTANTVTLTLLDLNGRQVAGLYTGSANEGTNTVLLSNKLNNVSSGTYFILLESQGRKASIKITISKQ